MNDIIMQERLQRGSVYFAFTVILLGILVLTGWQFNIEFFKSPLPDAFPMNPITAVSFIFSGISLLLLQNHTKQTSLLAGKILATIVFTIGFFRLLNLSLGYDKGIDEFLYAGKFSNPSSDPYNRMSSNTAINFIITGIALLVLRLRIYRKQPLSQHLAFIMASVAVLSVLGYIYQVREFYGILSYIPMAIYSAIGFLLLSLAILFTDPAEGIMKEFTSPLSGSIIARRLIPAAIIIPTLFGLLRLIAQREEFVSVEFGTAVLMLSIIIIFIGFIWYNALMLNKRDLENIKAQNALYESEKHIQTIFDAAPDAIVVIDEEGRVVSWNPKAENLFGWKPEEVKGLPLSEKIIPLRFREAHKNGLKHYLKTGEGPVLNKTIEIRGVTKNSDEIDVALSISPTTVSGKYLFIGFIRDITEIKKAEEKIKESENMFSTLFYKSPVMKAIAEATTGKYLEVNDAFASFWNHPKEEMIGKTSLELNMLIQPEHRDQIMKELRDNGYLRNGETQVTSVNGKTRWVSTNIDSLNVKGKDCFLTAAIDITARKEAEEKVRQMNIHLENLVGEKTREVIAKEKRFRSMVEKNIDMMTLATPDGKLLYSSPSLTNILGYTEEELKSIPAFELIHPHDVPGLMDQMSEILGMPGKSFTRQQRLLHKNGRWIWCEGTITNLLEEPDIGALVSNFRDITERREAEEKIRSSEKQLRQTLDNMLEGVQIIGFDWKYLYVNDAMAKHGKYKKEELLGHTVMEKYPGIEQTEIYKVYQRCFNERVAIQLENEFVFPDKSRAWFELSFQPVPEGIFILSIDITERKKAQLEIEKFNEELEQKVNDRTRELKLANNELEAFSYSISHDLRAPLRAINGFTLILKEDYAENFDQEGKRLLSVIDKNTTRMGHLIDDLLAFSRLGRKEPSKSPLAMNHLVEQLVSEIKQSEEHHATSFSLHHLPDAKGDMNMIMQVWANLVANAVKYSSKKEKVQVEIGGTENGKEVTYYVKDHGVGFDMQYADKLFGVFQRLHKENEFEGTGVGLAIVRRIINKHGGKVWAEGEVDAGATFYFTLPT